MMDAMALSRQSLLDGADVFSSSKTVNVTVSGITSTLGCAAAQRDG